jgi:tetratricopeptide (TPR) repeat protein
MSLMRITLPLFLCTLLSVSGFSANLLPPELASMREIGTSALFNMNYDAAKSAFQEMISTDSRNPAGYIYMANTIWLGHLAKLRRLQTNVYNRGNSFFSKNEDAVDPEVDKEFRNNIDKAITLCEARLKIHKDDVPTLYYYGIAKNIVAGYEATVKRSFISALKNGSKGVGLHRKAIQLDPTCIDAELSIGMYNYIVGSLPFAVKVLAFLGGIRGSKKDGIVQLERVSRDGNYAKDEAKVLLVMLYKREKRTADALKVLDSLVARYPENSLFRLERAETLGELKKISESKAAFHELLDDPAANTYMPDLIHFQFGSMLFDAKLWPDAHSQFVLAYQSDKAPAPLVTIAHLNAGKCLDAMPNRQGAKWEYQMVLKRPDVFNSREQATKYLKKPFVAPSLD